jgi:hypothetical protein
MNIHIYIYTKIYKGKAITETPVTEAGSMDTKTGSAKLKKNDVSIYI